MKPMLAALIVVITSSSALAQDVATVSSPTHILGLRAAPGLDLTRADPDEIEPPPPVEYVRAVVRPTDRLSRRVFVVLDVSGSMTGDSLQRAMRLVGELLHSPIDDYELAIGAFSDRTWRWEGVPEPDDYRPVPQGWARFPSMDALNSAQAWLSGFRANGGTNPCAALREALQEGRKDMSVLLVTDGKFDNGPAAALEVFNAEMSKRRVVFMVYGVGNGVENEAHLAYMGREGGGGFWVDAEPPKNEEGPGKTFH